MIFIENEQEKVNITPEIESVVRTAIEHSMKSEKLDKDYEVSVLFVDDSEIRGINKEHRDIDKATDVLSFPMVDFHNGQLISDVGDYDLDEELLFLGDIIISAETAERQAKEYGHSLLREIAFLTAHSCFHLLGYDHMEPEEETVMKGKQEAVLLKMGLQRE